MVTELFQVKTIAEQLKINDKYRPLLAKKFSKEPTIQPKNNQGLVFFTGSSSDGKSLDNGALHSEPKMDIPRMFISILPSSEENIMALQMRQNKMSKLN